MQDICQGLIITDPQTGTRYSLIKKLGEGGFGEVWLAYDKTDIHHEVAIKFFNPLSESDKNLFLSEYERSAKFHHKDVLPSLFYGEWGNRLFMGMGFCENGTATQFVGELKPIEGNGENLLWNLISDVASGLEYLHDVQNIVHQDIKPENIMITSYGDFVIMDFGISINVNSRLAALNYKDFGSPAYMAPERFSDSGNVIYANDIWSFGVMIHELATGELPFNGLGGNYIIGDIPSLPTEWSRELNKVMQSCLVYHSWDRKRAKDIKEYANWILTGKRGLDPWRDYIPKQQYPNHNSHNNISTDGTRGTQRNGSNPHGQSSSSSVSSGRSTSRNNGSNNSSHSQHNNGRATERNNGINGQNNQPSSYPPHNPPNSNINDGLNNSNNDSSGTDEDMKFKKKCNILSITCGVLVFVCIGLFLFFSNKISSLETDFNSRITAQGEIISNFQNLVHSISNVCNSSFGNNKVKTFQNWKSSNHQVNSQDTQEYNFTGRQGDEISFSYKVDSEQGCDKFISYLISPSDTIKLLELSGRAKKGIKTYTLSSNAEYILMFQYNKDYSVNSGDDIAEVSDIKIKESLASEILGIIEDSNQ